MILKSLLSSVNAFLFPRKYSQLKIKNEEIRKVLRNAPRDLRKSSLSPDRNTVSEIIYLDNLQREFNINEKLKHYLVFWVILSKFGIMPKF